MASSLQEHNGSNGGFKSNEQHRGINGGAYGTDSMVVKRPQTAGRRVSETTTGSETITTSEEEDNIATDKRVIIITGCTPV